MCRMSVDFRFNSTALDKGRFVDKMKGGGVGADQYSFLLLII